MLANKQKDEYPKNTGGNIRQFINTLKRLSFRSVTRSSGSLHRLAVGLTVILALLLSSKMLGQSWFEGFAPKLNGAVQALAVRANDQNQVGSYLKRMGGQLRTYLARHNSGSSPNVAHKSSGLTAPFLSCTWNGTSGDWTDAARWSCLAVPGPSDTATISNGGVTVSTAVTVGTLHLTGGGLAINPGATLSTGGNGSFSSSVLTGAGNFTITGTLVWTNGTMSGTGTTTIASGAILDLTTGGQKFVTGRTIDNFGMVNNNGIVTVPGSGDLSLSNVTFNNKPGGTFNQRSDADIVNNSGIGDYTFNNQGTFRKSGPADPNNPTRFTRFFNNMNNGQVLLETGKTAFEGQFTQTGGSTMLKGGALGFGPTGLIQGGTLGGNGTITGSVNTSAVSGPSGGTLVPGLSPPDLATGALTITGAYTQGAGGALALELSGLAPSEFDRLTINGTATLNGTLNVSFINPFTPSAGNTWQILSGGLRNGPFRSLNLATLGGALYWNTNNLYSSGTLSVVICPVIRVSPVSLPSGLVGSNYSQAITATDGVGPYVFGLSAGTLPSGLTLTDAGALTGTLTPAGFFPFTVQATDANGCIGIKAYSITINAPPAINAVPVSRQQGSPVSNLTIANVTDPDQALNTLTVTVNSGASATVNGVMVSGISVNAAGVVTANVIAGCTATTATFTLTVTDAAAATSNAPFTVTVTANSAPTLTYGNASVVAGGSTMVNPATGLSDNGSVSTVVVQSQGAYTGTISVNVSGVVSISGAKPVGIHTIIIRATDNCNVFTDASFQLTVMCPTITVTNPPKNVWGKDKPFSQTFTQTGGNGTITWSSPLGGLPSWLTLNSSTGEISGTPTQVGTFPITVIATDSNNCTGQSQNYVLTIQFCSTITTGPIVFEPLQIPLGQGQFAFGIAGTPYETVVSATGGIAPYTFSVNPPNALMQAGLGLTQAGATWKVSGTPTMPGRYEFSLVATAANGCTGTGPGGSNYAIVVHASAPTLSVTTTADNNTDLSKCSLREAITAANTNQAVGFCQAGHPGYDTIGFNLPNVGPTPYTINLSSELPALHEATFINGSTGNASFSRVELKGRLNNSPQWLLRIEGNDTYIKSLVLNNTGGNNGTTCHLGNGNSGVEIVGGDGNVIEDCYLGTDATGTLAAPNDFGMRLSIGSAFNQIKNNVLSGNRCAGVHSSVGFYNIISGNKVGTTYDGLQPLGNGYSGIFFNGSVDTIVSGNTIAHNDTGVIVTGMGLRITRNDIFANPMLGIDLWPVFDPVTSPGVTPNDPGDGDGAANHLQNYPVLTGVDAAGVITGTLNSTPNTQFRLEFFANTACDPSGHGEGESFLGFWDVTTDANGNAIFTTPAFPPVVGKPYVAAVAIVIGNGNLGDTSEFSNCINTGTGTNVTPNLPPGSPQITFANVTTPGSTTVTPIPAAGGGTLPPGFSLPGFSTAFEVTTTAGFSGSIVLTFDAPATITEADFNNLRVMHNEGGVLVDRTILSPDIPAPDFPAKKISARVTSLSPFVVAGLVTTPVVTVTANPASPTAGQNVTLTAQVISSGLPVTSGSVTFKDGASLLAGPMPLNASGQAGFSTSALSGGTHTITAEYSGATLFNPASGNTSITVNCPAITLNPAALPNGMLGTPYNQTLTASGGAPGYTFSLSTGALPSNLTLSASGVVSGAPVESGTFNFTVRATDSLGCFGERAYVLVINSCPPIAITPGTLPASTSFTFHSQQLTASGGTLPYNFTLSAGTLPAGLTLTTGGLLSGTPTVSGTSNFTVRATDGNTCFGEQVYALVITDNPGLIFHPLPAPVRALETRSSPPALTGCNKPNAPIAAGTTFTLAVRTGCTGIPANASAVTGNVTVVPGATGGYLTLFPSNAPQPVVANSNFEPGEITNNVFTVGLGTNDGAFNLFASATTEVIVDITGYYGPPGAGGLYFHPLPEPVRLLETRPGFGGCFAPGTKLTGTGDPNADSSLDLSLEGRSPLPPPCNSIPAAAQALVGNATSVFPNGGGWLTLYPSGGTRPLIASSNYAGSDVINGPFTVKLGADGKFKVYSYATTDLVIDILGYYSPEAMDANGPGLLFNPLPTPVRLLETRPDFPGFPLTGCFRPNAPINGNQVYTQPGRGTCTVPSTARALAGNATVVNPVAGGFLTFWPSDAPAQPTVATSNYAFPVTFGYNRQFIVGLGTGDGAFKMYSQFRTDLIVDISGYFAP